MSTEHVEDDFDTLFNSLGCDSPAWSPQSIASDGAAGTAASEYSPWMQSDTLPQKLVSSQVRPTFLLNVPVARPSYMQSPETAAPSPPPAAASPKKTSHKRSTPQPPVHGKGRFEPGQAGEGGSAVRAGKGAMSHSEAQRSLDEVKRIAQRAKRSAIARSRPRDERGHFLSTGVALKIGTLESELNDSRTECSALREQVKQLQTQLWQLQQGQRYPSAHPHPEAQFMAPPVARSVMPLEYSHSIEHKYMPGSYRSGPDEKPFREKIDFSKVALRKTNSGFMTPQEREFYLNQQMRWEIGQGVNDMRRKADEYMRLHRDLPPTPNSAYFQFVGPVHPGEYNAPPSSVFSQPNKSGNVLLPAFREKVDLAQQATQLRKIDAYEHMQAHLQRQKAQIQQQQARLEQQHSAMLRQQHAQQQSACADQERSDSPHCGPASPMEQQSAHGEMRRSSGSFAAVSPSYAASPHWASGDAYSPAMSVEGCMSPHTAADDHMEMQVAQEQHHHHGQQTMYRFGGPPSDIYTPPEKIGNRQVPAFKEKVNFAEIQLNKTASPFSSPEVARMDSGAHMDSSASRMDTASHMDGGSMH